MSAKLRRQLLICTALVGGCVFVCFAAYDPDSSKVVGEIQYKDDTFRMAVCGGKMVECELHRPEDAYTYGIELQTVERGTEIWEISEFRESDVAVLKSTLNSNREAVVLRNDAKLCVYSFDPILVELLKTAPREIPKRWSVKGPYLLRKGLWLATEVIVVYLVLLELGLLEPNKTNP